MHLPTLSLLVVAAAPALGYTVALGAEHITSLSGNNDVKCWGYVFPEDDLKNPTDNLPSDRDYGVEQMECSSGCKDIDYDGKTFSICTDQGWQDLNIRNEATVSIDGGDAINIYPDGTTYSDTSSLYLGSSDMTYNYINNAS